MGDSPFLKETIDSILAVDYPIEHVLVCPVEKLDELKERFQNSTVICEQGNLGMYGAINDGLQFKGNRPDWDYFTYINDDDRLGPEFNQYLKIILAENQQTKVAYGKVRAIDSNSKFMFTFPVSKRQKSCKRLLEQFITPILQQGMVIPRQVYDENGGLNSKYKYAADLDYICSLLSRGFTFKYFPLVVGEFRFRSGQLSSDIKMIKTEKRLIIDCWFKKRSNIFVRLFEIAKFRLQNLNTYRERLKSGLLMRTERIYSK